MSGRLSRVSVATSVGDFALCGNTSLESPALRLRRRIGRCSSNTAPATGEWSAAGSPRAYCRVCCVFPPQQAETIGVPSRLAPRVQRTLLDHRRVASTETLKSSVERAWQGDYFARAEVRSWMAMQLLLCDRCVSACAKLVAGCDDASRRRMLPPSSAFFTGMKLVWL